MKLGKLKEDLLLSVGERLEEHGFKLRKSRQGFRKKFSDGLLCIHLAFITHVADFDVVVDVAIRFDRVEEVLEELLPSGRSNKVKKEVCTLGDLLHNISNKSVDIIPVSFELPFDQSVESVLTEIKSIAIPFLEEKSSRDAALRYLINSLPKQNPANFLNMLSAERAIVIMALEHRESQISELLSPEFGFAQTLSEKQASRLNGLEGQLRELNIGWT